jgi:ubiquitin carboxyl-terminal hydrolase 5/13
MLASMGFARHHVEAALKSTDNDADRAAEWLFSHADNLDDAVVSDDSTPALLHTFAIIT